MADKQALDKLERLIVRHVKKSQIGYDEFQYVLQRVREKTALKCPARGLRLPRLLTETELRAFFEAVVQYGEPFEELLFRLLLATACRVEEFTRIRKRNVDLIKSRIFIESGKGDKDGYVPFPLELGLAIRQQFQRTQEYLFESAPGKCYTPRAIQLKMEKFAKKAELVDETGKSLVHPHLFRHQTITFLLESGQPIQQVRRISRHATYDSMKIYDHLSLGIAHEMYQKIMEGKVL